MIKKYRKLFIALAVIFAIPVLVLLCCDISVKDANETEEETVVETVDPLDETALVLFDTGKGLTIKMSSEMEENKSGDHTVYYFSDNCMVSVKMIAFEELEEAGTGNAKSTIEDYIGMVEESNENIAFTKDSYGNSCTMYSVEGDDMNLAYYVTVRKGSEAFWMINFSCYEEEKAMRYEQFELWGSTIEVQ